MFKARALPISLIILVCGATLISAVLMREQSIRLDESQSLWVATRSVPWILNSISQNVHVPLYHVSLHFWVQIFGVSILSARLLSLFFYVITVPILYMLARQVSTGKVAYLTVALFSLSPFVAWFSNEARMYTLLAFSTSLSHLMFILLLKSRFANYKFLYFLSVILGLYTHYFFHFLLASQGLYLLIKAYTEKGVTVLPVPKNPLKSKYRGLILNLFNQYQDVFKISSLILSAYIFFMPWWYLALSHGGSVGSETAPLIEAPSTFNIFNTLSNFLFGFQTNLLQGIFISLWPLSLLFIFIFFTKRVKVQLDHRMYLILATIFPLLCVFAISFIKPMFLSRYLTVITPTLFVLTAWSILLFGRKLAATMICTLLILMYGLMLNQNSAWATPIREDYIGVSAFLSKNAKAHDVIAVTAPFTVYPIEYSYTGLAKIDTIPSWERYKASDANIPIFEQAAFEKQLEGYKKKYAVMWIVLSYDQGYEDKIRKHMNKYELYYKQTFSEGLEVRAYIMRYDVKSSK